MTKRELSQLYYLDKDIERERRLLAELEQSGAPDDIIAGTREVIRCKLRESEIVRMRTIHWIMQLDDAFLRQIFMMRHIDRLTWAAVAVRIGGDNTADGVRMAHDRYIARHNDAEPNE